MMREEERKTKAHCSDALLMRSKRDGSAANAARALTLARQLYPVMI